MGNEKLKHSKISSETNSGNLWLVTLMGKAILKQQFRNTAYSPTLEAKREALEDWSRLAARIGRARFTEGLMEAFLHTTFIPSCEDIEKYAPEQAEENGMYKPFPKLEPPNDPVTQDQLDRFNSLVKDICEGKVMTRKAPKSVDVPEVVVKGMKAKVIDKKAEAANDK